MKVRNINRKNMQTIVYRQQNYMQTTV